MGLLSNRISRDELCPGDHIYAHRHGHAYSHHGIFVGEDRVIHFNSTNGPKSVPTSSSSSTEPPCGKCGHDPKTNGGGLLRTCIDCFLKDHHLHRFEYGVSRSHFILKLKGTCSTEDCDPNETAVSRATENFNNGEGFGVYQLRDNNCEHFACYCKTGRRVSEQTTSKTTMFVSFFHSKSS
ncbi:unnamed protein product [Prunus armeniaca]|uniref:LRAT domain-containing protein n=1 Tax=Prunus armeniaca TaxID=36596 RepID=A0A6J5XJ16_PRUAR|nr:hypothetical protein GBA52_020191 [Prunus armeniaca]CAB4313986.1 unnamed protein product [Prunus armeniaca]